MAANRTFAHHTAAHHTAVYHTAANHTAAHYTAAYHTAAHYKAAQDTAAHYTAAHQTCRMLRFVWEASYYFYDHTGEPTRWSLDRPPQFNEAGSCCPLCLRGPSGGARALWTVRPPAPPADTDSPPAAPAESSVAAIPPEGHPTGQSVGPGGQTPPRSSSRPGGSCGAPC